MLLPLNVAGASLGCCALFERFDTLGSGTISVLEFVNNVLGLVPSFTSTPTLRACSSAVRGAVLRACGEHGVRAVAQALAARADGAGRVSRAAAADIFFGCGAARADVEVAALLREASRPHDFSSIDAGELIEALRGPLSRRARLTLDAVWARAGGGGAGTPPPELAALAAAPAAAGGALAPADILAQWPPGTLAVALGEWLAYGRDLRAALGCDAALEAALGGEGGGGGEGGAHAPGPLPGSPVAVLRASRGGGWHPSPHRGGFSASEATGVPVILGASLGRAQPPVAYEELFGKGHPRAVPNVFPTVPFGAGSPKARALGTTLLQSYVGPVSRGGATAELYTRTRGIKLRSPFAM
jgi:hypothetical protein